MSFNEIITTIDEIGSNNNPILSEIRQYGYFPPTNIPTGWDGHGFRKIFPTEDACFQDIELIGSAPVNRLIWGDNLAIMRSLPDESIDLIYIDPPFFSGRNYNKIFGDEDEERTFRDIWAGGLETYLAWMNARLYEIKRLLKPSGSLFIHLDWHACHYVKIELDRVFGYDNFVNEIIWKYDTGGASKKRFARKHDNIFIYKKGLDFKFFPERIREKRTEKSIKRAQNPNGARISANNTTKLPTDVWQIPSLNPMATERIGYPTQKPEELLKKIIVGCTDENDMVADFFCGSGTTLVAAQNLNRRFIGSDINPQAIEICQDRLLPNEVLRRCI